MVNENHLTPQEHATHAGRYFGWTLHGDGKAVGPHDVVAPEERLSIGRTVGIGVQHVIAMFGATLLVPAITGFPVNTTLLFSGLGTILFLLVTRNRLPSYLGSSFAFIAPLTASQVEGGMSARLGGIVVAGAVLMLVGVIVSIWGKNLLDAVMPPTVTGAIVALIGLNLSGTAAGSFQSQPLVAAVTLAGIVLTAVATRGMLARLAILIGVIIGWIFAALYGAVDDQAWETVRNAPWVGLPEISTPTFNFTAIAVTLPVVVVLIAENVGHVKAVSSMAVRNLDDVAGPALIADGAATMLAGTFGGSGTTTYAENIGVMAATRVYSTAAYWVAASTAIALAFIPKIGALILTIPTGVLGGATVVLYGMIGLLGVRIWSERKVSFTDPVNLFTVAVALVVGIGNLTLAVGGVTLEGIAWGSVGIIVFYPIARWLYDNVGEGRWAVKD